LILLDESRIFDSPNLIFLYRFSILSA